MLSLPGRRPCAKPILEPPIENIRNSFFKTPMKHDSSPIRIYLKSLPKDRKRQVAAWYMRIAEPLFTVSAATAVLAFLLVAVLLVNQLSRDLPKTKSLPDSIFVLTFLAFAAWHFGTAIREMVGSGLAYLDLCCRKLLTILFGGLSEVVGLPQAILGFLYYSLAILSMLVNYRWTKWWVQTTDVGAQLQATLVGREFSFHGVLSLYAGLLVFLSILALAALPLRMIASQAWKDILQRTRLSAWKRSAQDMCLSNGGSNDVVIAHVSDLHAQRTSTPLTESGAVHDHWRLDATLRDIGNDNSIDAVVVSGDLTDDGSVGAWRALIGRSSFRALSEKMVLAPGNHDLNYVEPADLRSVLRLAHPANAGGKLRALRFLEMADLIMGERAHVVCPYTDRWSRLSEVMDRARADLDDWANDKPLRPRSLTPEQVLQRCFPMWVTLGGNDNESAPAFLVWNSVSSNRWPWLNALGDIGPDQLIRAKRLIAEAAPLRPVIHVMHHQVGLPAARLLVSPRRRSWRKEWTAPGMAVQRPAEMLNWLGSLAQESVVLHGHHHKCFAMRVDAARATIVSAPSATLGCVESYVDGLESLSEGMWLKLRVRTTGRDVSLADLQPRRVPAPVTRDASSIDTQSAGPHWSPPAKGAQ